MGKPLCLKFATLPARRPNPEEASMRREARESNEMRAASAIEYVRTRLPNGVMRRRPMSTLPPVVVQPAEKRPMNAHQTEGGWWRMPTENVVADCLAAPGSIPPRTSFPINHQHLFEAAVVLSFEVQKGRPSGMIILTPRRGSRGHPVTLSPTVEGHFKGFPGKFGSEVYETIRRELWVGLREHLN